MVSALAQTTNSDVHANATSNESAVGINGCCRTLDVRHGCANARRKAPFDKWVTVNGSSYWERRANNVENETQDSKNITNDRELSATTVIQDITIIILKKK